MKAKYFLILISLIISLFIYLFYRTDKTIVNEIVIRLISFDSYLYIKEAVVKFMPLNKLVVFSLPEGLWVFCITLTSRSYYIAIYKWHANCVYIPIIFCVGLEIFQLFHLTNGRFDFLDIGVSFVFWVMAGFVFADRSIKQNIFAGLNSKAVICFATYSIVYLAHVVK